MFGRYLLVTERGRNGTYNHTLTHRGKPVTEIIPDYIQKIIDEVYVTNMKHLADSRGKIKRLETNMLVDDVK